MGSTSKHRPPPRPIPVERRPPMLKDFLLDANSCSSAGFPSFPRRLPLHPPPALKRSRSRSRAAADATLSALHKLLNAVRASLPLPSVAVKSSKKKPSNADTAAVRVKDILRWKSFRDLIDSRDYAGDVRGEDPMRVGAGDGLCSLVGRTPAKTQESAPVREDEDEEEEEEKQQTPVSVLESPILFRDKEESSVSSFDQSLANVERKRARLLESINWFEGLASGLDPTNLYDQSLLEDSTDEDEVDEEVITKHCCHKREEVDSTKAYQSTHRVVSCIEECVRDMEKEAQWGEFEEHRTQLSSEMEMGILNALLDELLFEIVGGSDCESVYM